MAETIPTEQKGTGYEAEHDLFEELRAVALRQSMAGEFPDLLLKEILHIADTPDSHAETVHLIETLIAQIDDFDPYAGTGCFGNSVGPDAIGTTIRQVVALAHVDHGGEKACEISGCSQS